MNGQAENTSSGSLLESSHPAMSRLFAHNDAVLVIALAGVLATLLVPLPTFLLDLLLAGSIGVGLATMVVVLAANEAIEFAAFPSLLLFVTLYRLSLNVASTRLILLQGNAGQIIQTFGHFVVGGNLVIGLVVFLILVIIQFVVITKGAERISEVAARFNLDAMPGKQMAIDADLNAGLIGEDEARRRREKIVRESEFYGAMDGASKFIRGDAIAGLVITAVNLLGGFVVGMSRGLTAAESVKTYAILAVGDGLVTQIPALIISTASGLLISKTSSKRNLSEDLARQFLARSRPIALAAVLLAAMIFVPGFPKVPFLVLALGAGLLARRLRAVEQEGLASRQQQAKGQVKPEDSPIEELLDVDRIAVQVGPRLIKTIDPRRKSSLSHRIAPLRRKFAQQYGFVLPLVRLRDSVALASDAYEIRIHNHGVAIGQLDPDRYLAMDGGAVREAVPGQPTREPVFRLPALWIDSDKKEQAELNGYTVVEPESVLVTHLSEVLRRHAHELLSRDDVQGLVDRLRERQPALVNGVIGEVVSIGLLQRVLRNLLREGVPIRGMAQILETLGEHGMRTKDASALTEMVRRALARAITEQHMDSTGQISAVLLDPPLEYELRSCLQREGEAETLNLAPERALELLRKVSDAWQEAMNRGLDRVVLLCEGRLRVHLAMLLARQLPQLPVLAYEEIVSGTSMSSVATVSLEARPAEALTG